MLTVSAPAKVNLVLEILGRGPHYHDICSIAQTIDLCDTLTFEPADDIEFTCSDPTLMRDNLALRAAHLLRERHKVRGGARIHLEKRIPAAQGLGGGSSDAASTLSALNRMWALGLAQQQLAALGAELGSDVPLFLTGGTVLLEGRGEQVCALHGMATTPMVLLAPTLSVPAAKTAAMYGHIRPDMYTRGQFVRAASFALSQRGQVPNDLMFNVFEKVATNVFPELAQEFSLLEESCGGTAHLAGSGPCLYALVESDASAVEAVQRLEAMQRRAFATRTIGPVAS